ncbi:MAG: Rho termination factor N-terminal domain-containing protein, partial [Mycobacterium sp.]
MTETELFTAGDGTEDGKLSNSVNTDTPTASDASAPAEQSNTTSDGSLSTMVLPELRALANRAGVKGTSGMRKTELIAAIRQSQGKANGTPANSAKTEQTEPASDQVKQGEKAERSDTKTDERESDKSADQQRQRDGSGQQNRGGDDDGDGRGGRRGRRFRERRRRGERAGEGGEAELREDDVVQPVAGILDVLDNYAFVRTSGYLPGPNDVYVSMNMVRKNGLRRGDAVTGAVRLPKDGEQPNQRQKFNPLVRLDSINGGPVDDAKKRPDFNKLTPLYPNQRLRLETTSERLTTRVIDLIMPIGTGQRALIVSPPKAGKTTILQDTANAIAMSAGFTRKFHLST